VWRQWLLVGVSLVTAVIVQVTLLSRLGLPGEAPDLTLVTVVALAFALGRMAGAVSGFVAGMLLALAPPATTPLGLQALVFMAVGFIVGGLIDPRDRTVPITIAIVSGSVAGATFVVAVLDALLGRVSVPWDHLGGLLVASVIYAAILTPLVVPIIGRLARKLEPVKSTVIGS